MVIEAHVALESDGEYRRMLCHCDACNYTFESSVLSSKYQIPKKCPECRKITVSKGVPAVRAATEDEIAEYRRSHLDDMEEIFDILNNESDGNKNVIPFPRERRT